MVQCSGSTDEVWGRCVVGNIRMEAIERLYWDADTYHAAFLQVAFLQVAFLQVASLQVAFLQVAFLQVASLHV